MSFEEFKEQYEKAYQEKKQMANKEYMEYIQQHKNKPNKTPEEEARIEVYRKITNDDSLKLNDRGLRLLYEACGFGRTIKVGEGTPPYNGVVTDGVNYRVRYFMDEIFRIELIDGQLYLFGVKIAIVSPLEFCAILKKISRMSDQEFMRLYELCNDSQQQIRANMDSIKSILLLNIAEKHEYGILPETETQSETLNEEQTTEKRDNNSNSSFYQNHSLNQEQKVEYYEKMIKSNIPMTKEQKMDYYTITGKEVKEPQLEKQPEKYSNYTVLTNEEKERLELYERMYKTGKKFTINQRDDFIYLSHKKEHLERAIDKYDDKNKESKIKAELEKLRAQAIMIDKLQKQGHILNDEQRAILDLLEAYDIGETNKNGKSK